MTRTESKDAFAQALPAVASTAVGSFPTVDVREVAAIVRGELPELPILAELPARGPGADMIGRTASLLAQTSTAFACQTTPTGWRIASSKSGAMPRAMRAGGSWLGEDLDVVEELFDGYSGAFKVQLAGPWTMAASIELPNGEKVLSDRGAYRDLLAATADAVTTHLGDVARRLPGASLLIQFDEPLLDRVLLGSVVRQSGFGAISNVEPNVVVAGLRAVFDSANRSSAWAGIHSCAGQVPILSICKSSPDFISIDMQHLEALEGERREFFEAQLATQLEAGAVLFAGLDVHASRVAPMTEPLRVFLDRTGLPLGELQRQIVVTPTCGLANEDSLDSVRRALGQLRESGSALRGQSVSDARPETD